MLPKDNSLDLNAFSDYFKESEKLIDKRLERFFKDWQREAISIHPILADLIDRFEKINSGGKKIRGLLVRLGYELAGGKDKEAIITVAAAYEILHTFLLIHDDIIDRAKTRRGMTTFHLQYEDHHTRSKLAGNSKDYGIAMAIVAGDVGSYLFLKLFTESSFDPSLKNKALDYLAGVLVKTGFGQALDVDLGLHKTRSYNDVFLIHDLKTSHYTLLGPLITGAILAGANPNLVKRLVEFGQPLGLAFQIKDDVLGVYGSDKKTGKSSKSDIEEGKNTLLISYALKHAKGSDLVNLKKIYGRSPVSDRNLSTIQKIFGDCGALKYSNNQAENLLKKSLAVLDKTEIDPRYKTIFSQMAKFLVVRES